MDFSNDVKPLFLDSAPFEMHVRAQEANKDHLMATLITMENNKVDIPSSQSSPLVSTNYLKYFILLSHSGAKVKCLAAAWARHDHELAKILLGRDETFGVVEVLKALQVLDAGRKERSQEKKLAQLKSQMQTAGKLGKSRIGRKIAALKVDYQCVWY